MAGSRFDDAVAGVRDFVVVRDGHARAGGSRCRLTLQVTFMEANVGELPALVELAADLGADRVKGHHVWAHWPALASQALRRSADAMARWNTAASRAKEIAERRGLLLENVVPLSPATAGGLDPEAACPFLGREAWIAFDGRFHPCCAPDEQRRSLGDFGNVRERSLSAIWSSPAYRGLVSGYRAMSLCQRCSLRRRPS